MSIISIDFKFHLVFMDFQNFIILIKSYNNIIILEKKRLLYLLN